MYFDSELLAANIWWIHLVYIWKSHMSSVLDGGDKISLYLRCVWKAFIQAILLTANILLILLVYIWKSDIEIEHAGCAPLRGWWYLRRVWVVVFHWLPNINGTIVTATTWYCSWCLSPLKLWVRSRTRGVFDATLCGFFYQCIVECLCFFY